MKATILNIGDELLIGQVVNTNAARMSQHLIAAGMEVVEVCTIADQADAIRSSLERLMLLSDAVLITGGLGPTKDDITKHTLCQFFGSRLVESPVALDNVKRIFDARGYELTPINRQQALVPECCTVVNNYVGTAPCMWFEQAGKVVISMPGVPFEMEWLMANEIIPRLREHFSTGHILNKNLLVQGIGESFLSDLIEQWELALPQCIKLAYLPQAGMVKLRLTARGNDLDALQSAVDKAVTDLKPIAGQYIVGEDCEDLPQLVAQRLTAMGLTLATAESCTGGTIAQRLAAIPGASAFLKGGVVAYSNEVKMSQLGVSADTLAAHGAVSEETVREMVCGARKRLGADIAVATTGIAGPTGGTPEKPVGTVWIGLAYGDQVVTKCMHYGDRRQQTIDRTANETYSSIIKLITNQ